MLPTAADSAHAAKCQRLHAALQALPGAVVAFSGGVDSTALLHACRAVLGDRTVAVTADSPSLPRAELAEARQLAAQIGVRHVVLPTHELERPEYRANAGDRCYHCKRELFLTVAAQRTAIAPAEWPVLYGLIHDDLADHRPGQRAAAEHGVLGPLADAGFTKADVRRYCRTAGLPNADKPSLACLASRVPFGTPVDAAVLARIEAAEARLQALGFRQFRVRHHGDVARLEIAPDELERAFALREQLGRELRSTGYVFVALDVFGYRSGSLNELLHRP
ncbi:MAG: ATP-dependent sacrificial sulfur transferase LarE [Planctomycetes bacterium]|nr:ATP-dependent sacrificial sulfur transferase LarE [Planctomycetota bacterium]